jgi:surfactin synthase thioesterase subunit
MRRSQLIRGASSNLRVWSAADAVASGATASSVLCFAPAGGQSLAFRPLADAMPDVSVGAVDLPGHGTSTALPLASVLLMAAQAVAWLDAELAGPVVLVGHSFGACVALETARLVARRDPSRPLAIAVVCAADPVALGSAELPGESDDELLAFMTDHGGVPEELLARPDYLLPHLRLLAGDLRAAERYARSVDPAPVDIPARLVLGNQDALVVAEYAARWPAWLPHVVEHRIDAGHHVPRDAPEELAAIVRDLRTELDRT